MSRLVRLDPPAIPAYMKSSLDYTRSVKNWNVMHTTLSQSCLKVHGGVPIALCICLDPLVLRINCLVIRE